jgi:replicative DNA helicase
MNGNCSQSNHPRQPSLANINIENAVLGSLIAGGRGLIDKLGVEAIDPNLFFYSQSHKILSAIAELYDEATPYDLQVVTERLRQHGTLEAVDGAAAITVLGVDGNPAPEIVRYNLELLRDLEVKRRIGRVGERMQRGDIDLEEAYKALNEIRTRACDHSEPLIEFRSPLELKNFTPSPGLVLVGDCHIVKGSLFVIGGAPGIGKSRAAVAMAVAGAHG